MKLDFLFYNWQNTYNEIMNTFAGVKPKMPRKEYEFETIELV